MTYIVDSIRLVVEAMRISSDITPELIAAIDNTVITDSVVNPVPFFMAGHPLEISNRLTERTEDRVYQYLKYPLVALRMDIVESVRGDMIDYNLNLAIMTYTDRSLIAEERIEQVFKPILHSLYELFFKELKNSGKFVWSGNLAKPEHRKIDRPFWGTSTETRNEESIFSDPLDAVEILDLKISSYNC
jgi:hypothetical protein